MTERSKCEYCGGNTVMDDYGNCRACGAPKPIRELPQVRQEKYHWDFGLPSTDMPMTVCTSTAPTPIMLTTQGIWNDE